MPRHNRTQKHTPYQPPTHRQKKVRFDSERLALQRADELMLLNPSLSLRTYHDIDGGWYLTTVKDQISEQ